MRGEVEAQTGDPTEVAAIPLRILPAQRGSEFRVTRLALERACKNLLERREPGGAFLGALTPSVALDARDVLMREFLGIRDPAETRLSAQWIRSQRREDGTLGRSHAGPPDLSVMLEAYTVLRLAGDSAETGPMRHMARSIRDLGGVGRSGVSTRFRLALFGLWPWRRLPALPPELLLLSSQFPAGAGGFEGTLETLLPMSVLAAHQPVRSLSFRIDELKTDDAFASRVSLHRSDERPAPFERLLSGYERFTLEPLRRRALAVAEERIVRGQRDDGTWLGRYVPSIHSLLALQVRGYSFDHPVFRKGVAGLDSFERRERGIRRIEAQPSSLLDTASTLVALGDAGVAPDHPSLVDGAEWLLEREAHGTGGWSGDSATGGPAIGDTAEVAMALRRVDHPEPMRVERAVARAVSWTLEAPKSGAAWASGSAAAGGRVGIAASRLNPGARANRPDVDITTRVIEMLAGEGLADAADVARARDWIVEMQQGDGSWLADGSWPGPSGAGALRATAAAMSALAALGEKPSSISVQRSVHWLSSLQNSDGGWCGAGSVSESRNGSTAPLTAWALLALLAAGVRGVSVGRAAQWLADAQRPDGGWDAPIWAEASSDDYDARIGTHRMGHTLPTLALGRYLRAHALERDPSGS